MSEESIVCGGGEGSFERGTHRHRVELVLALRQLSFQQVHCIEDLRGVCEREREREREEVAVG